MKNLQDDEGIKKFNKECLLTIAGLKLLNENYSENKKEWRLVAQKGKAYLKKSLTIDDKQIDEVLSKFKLETIA